MQKDRIAVQFLANAANERFARIVVGAYAARLNPTVRELEDIRTAVSEAVTNAIIHGYDGQSDCSIELDVWIENDRTVSICVRDFGVGIADVSKAMEPFYTSKPELERSGMGFTVMCSFMDELIVHSTPDVGTTVIMRKHIGQNAEKESTKNSLKKSERNT